MNNNKVFLKYSALLIIFTFLLFILLSATNPPPSFMENQVVHPLWKMNSMNNNNVAVTALGEKIIIVGEALWIFNTEGKLIIKTAELGRSYIKLSTDGKYILIDSCYEKCNWDGYINLLDINGAEIWKWNTGSVTSMAMTPSADSIVIGAFDEESIEYYTSKSHIYLFNRDGKKIWDYKTREPIRDVSISSDGEIICASTEKHNLIILNNKGDILWSRMNVGIGKVSQDGKNIVYATMGRDGRLIISDIKGTEIQSFELSNSIPRVLEMTNDANYIGVATLEAFYFFNRQCNSRWNYSRIGNINSIAFNNDGKYIAIGALENLSENNIIVFNKKGDLLWKYNTMDTIFCLDFNDDGKYLGAGVRGSRLFFFDNFKAIEEYKKHLLKFQYLTRIH